MADCEVYPVVLHDECGAHMKKSLAIAAAVAVSIMTSWGDTTNILSRVDIAIAGKLIPAGTAVTGKDLSEGPIAISSLDLQVISGTTTQEVAVIGQVLEV